MLYTVGIVLIAAGAVWLAAWLYNYLCLRYLRRQMARFEAYKKAMDHYRKGRG